MHTVYFKSELRALFGYTVFLFVSTEIYRYYIHGHSRSFHRITNKSKNNDIMAKIGGE